MASVRRRLDPRYSSAPVLGAFPFGLVLPALFPAAAFRAGPVPIMVTAPFVAVRTYARLRLEAGVRRLPELAASAIVATGLARLYFLRAVSYRLPRSMKGSEMVLSDFGVYRWFVVALTAAYAVAARTYDRAAGGGRRRRRAARRGRLAPPHDTRLETGAYA